MCVSWCVCVCNPLAWWRLYSSPEFQVLQEDVRQEGTGGLRRGQYSQSAARSQCSPGRLRQEDHQ